MNKFITYFVKLKIFQYTYKHINGSLYHHKSGVSLYFKPLQDKVVSIALNKLQLHFFLKMKLAGGFLPNSVLVVLRL
jgi:hypothetical protein